MTLIGLERFLKNVRRTNQLPDIKNKIRHHLLNCYEYSSKICKQEGYLESIPKSDQLFLTLHIDNVGLL